MAKINRYDGNLKAFASAAESGERTIFGETSTSDDLTENMVSNFFRGWFAGVNDDGFPTEQWFNAFAFVATQLAAYLHQSGVAEYNAAQVYYTDSFCNYNGKLYVSLIDNNTGNIPGSSPANWQSVNGLGLAYVASDTYSTNDFVSYLGVLYYSLVDNNIGNTPSSSPAAWSKYLSPNISIDSNTSQASSTAIISSDPTSGTEFLSASITPKSITSKILVEFNTSNAKISGAIVEGMDINLVDVTNNLVLCSHYIDKNNPVATYGWPFSLSSSVNSDGLTERNFSLRFGLRNSVGGEADIQADPTGSATLKVSEIL